MKKWTKKILFAVAILLAIGLIILLSGVVMLRGTPDWYQPGAMTAEQREEAAQRATNKLAIVQNAAVQMRVDEMQAATSPSTKSRDAITISFTDDEMNAFFEKWSVLQNIKANYEKFVTDPAIILQDGRIILAGRAKDIGAIVSFHFEARIDEQGRLDFKLVRILAGNLPLPQALVTSYQHQAAGEIDKNMPTWRRRASINSIGVANPSAISAAMGSLLENILNQQTADAVLFLPLLERGSIPVKVLDVQVADHALTLIVQPMTPPERAELLRKIRGDNAVSVK
jgi:uncharacterized protein YpmS